MKILRRVAGPSSPQTVQELAELGVKVSAEGWFGFWFDEADPRWPDLRAWRTRQGWTDEALSMTEFTRSELKAAASLEFSADWQWGYPQPHEDVFGYRKVTYDDSAFCQRCGVGLRQVAPFELVGEPKWGRRNVLQLNWVFDEIFVTPGLWEGVFRDFGIPAREVRDAKGHRLATVVQLVVDDRVDLEMGAQPSRRCEVCSVVKYDVVSRGFFPPTRQELPGAIVKSNQWFGSGAKAFQTIVASRELYAALEQVKVKGARFVPSAG